MDKIPSGRLRFSSLFRRIFFTALMITAVPLQSSCTLIPFLTSRMIENKMAEVTIGSTQQEVFRIFGNPAFRMEIQGRDELEEIWGYDLGHYWYHESVLFFFRRGKVTGYPRNSYDALDILRRRGLLDPAAVLIPSRNPGSS